jgi:hypothetical protein
VRLFAALVPPAVELDRARVLAAGVPPVLEPDAEAEPERHRSGGRRWFRRRRNGAERPPGPMLNLLPMSAMHLPMVKFGNLSTADAARVADEMERRAPEWSSPRLRLEGGRVLQPEGRTSVWLNLTGDLNEVRDVVRGVSHVALGLSLFVDRRIFQPELQLALVNDRTTPTYLESLLTELETFESNAWWQTTFSLMVAADDNPAWTPVKVYREIALGPAVPH